MIYKGSTLEYKRGWDEDIIPEIVSFLNSHGGTLFIGIDDSGEIVGVDDPDALLTEITNKIRDCISPIASMLIYSEIVTDPISGKHYITCQVSKGISPPYFVTQKGITEGVYIRSGSGKIKADSQAIKALISQANPVKPENQVSPVQTLQFVEAEAAFARLGLPFSDEQKISLGLKTIEGQYTDLGLILSDQCPDIIKAASFKGEDMLQHRAEIGGSILKQLRDAEQFISIHNDVRTTIDPKTFMRSDQYKFPVYSVREAILNALVHRDYSLPHPTLIKINADRIDILSFGGLLPDITLEELAEGITDCRNQSLANIFYMLNLVDAYGTGLSKIRTEYQSFGRKPEIKANSTTFTITLPSTFEQNR